MSEEPQPQADSGQPESEIPIPPGSGAPAPQAEFESGQAVPLAEPGAGEPEQPQHKPERYPFWSYGDLALFFGLAFPSLLLGWALVRGFVLVFGVRIAARAAGPLTEQFAGYLILFGALALILRMEYNKPFWSSLAWRDFQMPFLWVVIFGLLAAFAVSVLGSLIRTPNTENTLTEMMQDRTSLILMTVFGVTLGPICEELAFRGFLQPLLERSLGTAPGILLAAIPFGLLHYQEYGNSWRHALIVAAAGSAFGWMRHVTGSTKSAAIMHAAYNAMFFSVVLSQRKDLL